MQTLFSFLGILFISASIYAQEPYTFTKIIDLEATPVINQGKTGTCWSFSSTSFLESEIIRITGKQIDLSEMFTVRNTYPKKLDNFIMRQGKAQFSEGGLAHDVLNSVSEYGLVPQEVYSGLLDSNTHNHAELVSILEAMAKTYISNPAGKLSNKWKPATEAVLDIYLGKNISEFSYKGKKYTPKSFLKETKIIPENYFTITSFTHAPFYKNFILNIPDNWSNGKMYNVPLNELIDIIDSALKKGFTLELDCDISEKTFSSKNGIAIIPTNAENNKKALKAIYPEMNISQTYRQNEYENYTTTDDHLMHITGLLHDQNGNKYYKVKNSWGTNAQRNTNEGYVYFSEAYTKLKTISITLHKDAIPAKTAQKLNI